MLTQEQQNAYEAAGYLAIPELFSNFEVDNLRRASERIVDGFDPESTRAIFTTKNHSITRDAYFLDSADKIRCFFEEDAFNEQGELNQAKSLSINKIGHALHELDPTFRAFAEDQRIRKIANAVGLSKPQIHQSMYIFKQPEIGGEVGWHQDASFFLTTPITVTTFWFALEDSTINNGCLRVAKNVATQPLKQQFVRHPDDRTDMVALDPAPWPEKTEAIPLEVKKGGLVVFKGLLPHFSEPNLSKTSRHALTFHITCATSNYAKENWIQAPPKRLF